MSMDASRWLHQKTGAMTNIKKKAINLLGVYAGKSEKVVYGKLYLVHHHFFVDSEGTIVKYEDTYEEV